MSDAHFLEALGIPEQELAAYTANPDLASLLEHVATYVSSSSAALQAAQHEAVALQTSFGWEMQTGNI